MNIKNGGIFGRIGQESLPLHIFFHRATVQRNINPLSPALVAPNPFFHPVSIGRRARFSFHRVSRFGVTSNNRYAGS